MVALNKSRIAKQNNENGNKALSQLPLKQYHFIFLNIILNKPDRSGFPLEWLPSVCKWAYDVLFYLLVTYK